MALVLASLSAGSLYAQCASATLPEVPVANQSAGEFVSTWHGDVVFSINTDLNDTRGAMVYRADSEGTLTMEAVLDDPKADVNGHSLTAASLEGDLLALAGGHFSGPLNYDSWFVFRRMAPGDWQLESQGETPPAPSSEGFGGPALDLDGGRVALGLHALDEVRLLEQDGSDWVVAQTLPRPASIDEQALFGYSLDLAGDTLAVGAINAIHTQAPPAVALYRRVAGVWQLEQVLPSLGAVDQTCFGWDVSLQDDTLAVCSPCPADGVDRIYLYAFDGLMWNLVQTLEDDTPDAVSNGLVVLDGDDLFTGRRLAPGGGPASFQVQRYRGADGPFALMQVLDPPDDSNGSGYGYPFDAHAGRLAASAYEDDPGGVTDAGRVFIDDFPPTCVGLDSLTPSAGLFHAPPPVLLQGLGFDGSLAPVVLFGDVAALDVHVLSETELQCLPPPATQGLVVDVTVLQAGHESALAAAYSYEGTAVTAVQPFAGSLTGGTTLTVTVTYPADASLTTVLIDGQAVPIVDQPGPDRFTVVTPPVPEASGEHVTVGVTSPNGTDAEPLGFLHTPALFADVEGDTATGGQLSLRWTTDPSVGGGQQVWLWLDDPLQPPWDLAAPGFAGLIHTQDLILLLVGFPAPLDPVVLSFGTLDPVLAGFPLQIQAVVSGEGGSKGALTNVATFAIP